MAHLTRDRLNVTLFAVQRSCPRQPVAKWRRRMSKRSVWKKKTSTWQWNHSMTEHLSTLFLPKLMYGICVYGSYPPELTTIQCFLDRCHKRRYTSSPVSIINCLQKSDKGIFKKLSEWERHPLHHSLPRINPATLTLRQVKPTLPICNTERFKNSFINRLSFNYNLATSN